MRGAQLASKQRRTEISASFLVHTGTLADVLHRSSTSVKTGAPENCSITARRYASAVYAVVVCLCLSQTQVGALQRWLNLGSHKQRHTIAQGL